MGSSPSTACQRQPQTLPDFGTWSLEATPHASSHTVSATSASPCSEALQSEALARTPFPSTPSPCIGTACQQFLPRLLGGSSCLNRERTLAKSGCDLVCWTP